MYIVRSIKITKMTDDKVSLAWENILKEKFYKSLTRARMCFLLRKIFLRFICKYNSTVLIGPHPTKEGINTVLYRYQAKTYKY